MTDDTKRTSAEPMHDLDFQVINSLTSGVIVLDKDGVILAANRAATQHLQIDESMLRTGSCLEAEERCNPLLEVFREVLQTKRPIYRRDILFALENGTKQEVGLSASLLKGPETFNGVIFLFTDMTERRNLERAAEINRQLAALGALTAGVVHELRNPVSVIS